MTAATTPPPHSPSEHPRRHRPGTARAALSYPRFRIVFGGMALSFVGTWMQNFTLPAYLDARTGSAALVGLLVFAQLGPLLVLSIPAGVLADRYDRTRIVVSMQAVMMLSSVVLAALVATDAPLWSIFVTQLIIGLANTVNAPAFSASLPMMVDRADLAGAISLNSAMINGSRIAGPALAALLAALGMSIPQLFLINAATFLFIIIPLVTVVRLPVPDGPVPERGWRQLTRGIAVMRERRVLSRVISTMFVFSLVSLPYVGLFPSVARLNLGVDPEGTEYKLIYIAWGLGAFLGALAIGTWLSRRDTRRLIPFGFLVFAACLAVFSRLADWRLALPVGTALGFAYFMTATALSTVLQRNLADSERASAMPLWFMAFGGTVPIGNLIAGPIMDAVGARWVLGAGAAGAIALAAWSNLAHLDEDDFLPEDAGGDPFVRVNANRLF